MVRDRSYVSIGRELIGTHLRTIDPPKGGGSGLSKSPPLKFQPTSWRLSKMSIEHTLGYIGWLWSGAMNNRIQLWPKPQMSECRSSTICVVMTLYLLAPALAHSNRIGPENGWLYRGHFDLPCNLVHKLSNLQYHCTCVRTSGLEEAILDLWLSVFTDRRRCSLWNV